MFHLARTLRGMLSFALPTPEERAARRAHERREVAAFCAKVVSPALEDLKQEWERLGRSVSVCRDASIFHITVWHDRLVEFEYSVAACRRRRARQRVDRVHPEAITYTVEPKRVYTLSEIRRTDRHKFARQIAEQYRRGLPAA